MTASDATEDRWTLLARLKRPQGRKGELLAEILTDFPEKFAERHRLFLLRQGIAPREVKLEDHWLHKGHIVLRFAGIDSINAAETLVGLEVAIPREERVSLAEGEAYIGDLIGCELWDMTPSTPVLAGVIKSVDRESGPTPLLVLSSSTAEEGELLIPFARTYLRRMDLDAHRLEMALPEGLLTINAPMTEEEKEERQRTEI